MRGDDGVGQGVTHPAHVGVDLLHVGPVDGALQRVRDHAEVHQRVPEIGVVEAALFPAAADVAREGHGLVLQGDAGDLGRHVAGIAQLAVGEAQEHAPLHIREAQLAQQGSEGRIVHIVELHHHAGLLGVGQAEHGGEAALALHHLPGGLHGDVPIFEHVGKTAAVLGHIAEHPQGDLCEDAEGTLRAHHYLVEIGAGGLPGVVAGPDDADGRGVALGQHDVGDGAVIGAVLARATGDRPAAHAGIFKALGKMAAGVGAFCAEKLFCPVQRILQHGAGHAGLHGDGLVGLVEGDDLIEAPAHIQGYAALYGLHAPGDAAAAAVDVQGYVVFGDIRHDLFHLLGRVGIHHRVGHAVHPFVAQTQDVVGCAAVSHAESVVIRGGNICVAHDFFHGVDVLFCQLHGVAGELHLVEADVVGVFPEVVVREVENVLHHLVQRFLGVLEKLRVAPAEYGAVAALGRRGQDPFGLEARIFFVAHGAYLLL